MYCNPVCENEHVEQGAEFEVDALAGSERNILPRNGLGELFCKFFEILRQKRHPEKT